LRFVCEGPDPTCVEIVELILTEYEEVRARPTRFFVLPGHQAVAVEANAAAVVEERDGVVIVNKIGIAGQAAAANHGKESVAEVESGEPAPVGCDATSGAARGGLLGYPTPAETLRQPAGTRGKNEADGRPGCFDRGHQLGRIRTTRVMGLFRIRRSPPLFLGDWRARN